ncbi:Gas vesicle synthesis protein GvpL/GvpF [Halogeometricum rufum]|uniref:Gas vesicle synthesis protein GvpL/GvpF n=1 Tax=Halogeometricum rufum TaxID=553469 RepID=A0A1I6GLW9_9EURY|nr:MULTISPECIES: GvpL/GvpF family gas vesicle protein [Halogeometricum]MUV56269.1 protein gvpF [Halogeometricum sp. CBA1124]SFR43168.1 Gas vesicle synthesis protein GvpL/GvpF [Halogeometricum rufum]
MSTQLYVYGVVDAEDFELEMEGVEGESPVETVTYRSLSAVVTPIDDMDVEQTDENSRAHDEVLRAVMTEGDGRAVVPMQFGMTFKSARTLKSVMRGGRRAFRKALMDVDDSVELGVKLVVDEDSTLDRETVADDVSGQLTAVSESEAENDLYSDRLLFNRSYLVDADERDAFGDAVADLEDQYPDVTVDYTGPWAPYNFVDIEIEAQ